MTEEATFPAPDELMMAWESLDVIKLTPGERDHLNWLLSPHAPAAHRKSRQVENRIEITIRRRLHCYFGSEMPETRMVRRQFDAQIDNPNPNPEPKPRRIHHPTPPPPSWVPSNAQVEVVDWYEMQKEIERLEASGYVKAAVGHYVFGEKHAWTCTHIYDPNLFTIVKY